MPEIEHYGGDGLTFDIKTPNGLWRAIDALHTMVCDNFPEGEDGDYLRVLETAMRALEALGADPMAEE